MRCIFYFILFFLVRVLSQDLIVISGYERNVEEARQSIQQLVAELQEMVSQDVHLDPRTHARIIGARGKAIRKLMEEFKVRCDDFIFDQSSLSVKPGLVYLKKQTLEPGLVFHSTPG